MTPHHESLPDAERLEFLTSIAHIELDNEIQMLLVDFLAQTRSLNRRIRLKQIAFVRPFIGAGYLEPTELVGLTAPEIRAMLWQVRQCIPKEDPVHKAVLPRMQNDLWYEPIEESDLVGFSLR